MDDMTAGEMETVKRFAEGDVSLKEAAEAIYLKHVAAHVDAGRKSAAMNFLSECFNISPDSNLKALYRRKLLV